MRRISSASTFFEKRIFPAFLFLFLTVLSYALLFGAKAGNKPPVFVCIFPLLALVFGYLNMKKSVFVLADEVLDGGDFLLVFFGKKQERIEIKNIMNVGYTSIMRSSKVTLTLREPCFFGKEVSFIPITTGWSNRSPIVSELIARVDAVRRAI